MTKNDFPNTNQQYLSKIIFLERASLDLTQFEEQCEVALALSIHKQHFLSLFSPFLYIQKIFLPSKKYNETNPSKNIIKFKHFHSFSEFTSSENLNKIKQVLSRYVENCETRALKNAWLSLLDAFPFEDILFTEIEYIPYDAQPKLQNAFIQTKTYFNIPFGLDREKEDTCEILNINQKNFSFKPSFFIASVLSLLPLHNLPKFSTLNTVIQLISVF